MCPELQTKEDFSVLVTKPELPDPTPSLSLFVSFLISFTYWVQNNCGQEKTNPLKLSQMITCHWAQLSYNSNSCSSAGSVWLYWGSLQHLNIESSVHHQYIIHMTRTTSACWFSLSFPLPWTLYALYLPCKWYIKLYLFLVWVLTPQMRKTKTHELGLLRRSEVTCIIYGL